MITIDDVYNIVVNRNLIKENQEAIYGMVNKNNINKDIIKYSFKDKTPFIIASSLEDLIIIPYNLINKEFDFNYLVTIPLNLIKVSLDKSFFAYTLKIYYNNSLLIALNFEKRHINNTKYYNALISFLNKTNAIGIEHVIKNK